MPEKQHVGTCSSAHIKTYIADTESFHMQQSRQNLVHILIVGHTGCNFAVALKLVGKISD